MQLLQWNDEKMALGITVIDEQHKELLNIINLLATSIKTHSQKDDIIQIVDELINYAKFHFTNEEEMFDKFDFKESDAHKKEHEAFFEKFTTIKSDISNNELNKTKSSIEIAEEVFSYLTKWFLNHIIGNDREYVQLLKENGVK